MYYVFQMIDRTVYSLLKEQTELKPVVLVTGARQVGKTTLCGMLSRDLGMKYVTLADNSERMLAMNDPDMFIKVHGYPIIIDEVHHAPGLFEAIEAVVDRERLADPDAHGLFVLTGSKKYRLMEGITQTMSGRVGIINVTGISLSEEYGLEESPFSISPESFFSRSHEVNDDTDMMSRIVRGMYPEIVSKKRLTPQRFYSDYVDTYIMRDVSEMINIRDRMKFRSFMEVVASLTGQTINYNTISNSVGINQKTVKNWLSVLEAGDIIFMLEPYADKSIVKRVTKSPKIYMKDTGLACYLAKIPDSKILGASYLKGPMTETFIINEIMKTHSNGGLETPFFFYRVSENEEIDLLMLYNGRLEMIECKSGMDIGKSDVKTFQKLRTDQEKVGCVVCLTDRPYPITDGVYAIPLRAVGS